MLPLIYIYMNKLIASLIVSVSLAGLAMADTGAANDDLSCEQVLSCIGDLVLVRPVGAAVTVANFGIFAVASPFAAMADATDEVFNTLVTEPGEYTFKRDLGDFSK
jgi:hypothetical protein